MTRLPGPASGTRCLQASSLWPAPFPPPPPPPVSRLCSRASPVLRGCLTSRARSSSACVLELPDAASRPHPRRTRELPVPVQGAPVRDRGLCPRGVLATLTLTIRQILPPGLMDSVGTPLRSCFRGSIPAPHVPLSTLRPPPRE